MTTNIRIRIPCQRFTRRWTPAALLVLCSGIATTTLRAQSMDYGSLEALFDEPVTTSVTGAPQRAGNVPATMVIISAEQIRRSGAIDIPGLLQHITGVDLLRWTSNGADVGVRGYNKVFSSRLLVLVNGRQVYADYYGLTSWSTLPVELGEIRQIEVVKGPNSALFGFNAAGGVINIITFNPGHDEVAFAEISTGTQQHRQFSAASTFALGNSGGIRVSGGIRKNDNFETTRDRFSQGMPQRDSRESVRIHLNYDLQPGLTAALEASYTDVVQTNMTPTYTLGLHQNRVSSIKGSIAADSTMGLTQGMIYANRIRNDAFANVFDGSGYSYVRTPYMQFNNDLWVAQLQHIFKAGADHTVRLSGEFRNSSVNTSPVAGGEIEYDVLSGAAMWNWQITPALAFTAAMRYDSLDLRRSGTFPAGLDQTNAYWDQTIGQASFNTGLVWETSDTDTLRLTTARGAQLPSLYNLGSSQFAFSEIPGFGNNDLFITGVPTLEPTTVINHELAWDRQLRAIDGELRVAWFVGDSRNIVSDWGGADFSRLIISQPANIGNSGTSGFEISINGNLFQNWHWSLGYTHQDIDDDFGSQYTSGYTFTNFEDITPRHIGNAGIAWTRGGWEVDARVQYQSAHHGLRADPEQEPGRTLGNPDMLIAVSDYVTANVRLGYRWSEKLHFAIRGQNLFTNEQKQTSGPAVERRVLATITLDF